MRRLLAAAAVAASLASSGSSAADSVDDYVRDQMRARKIPGLSLAVVQHGRIVKAAGYGVASLELSVPATAQTVYEIGSISKQFTADAVLLLVEEGKVGLDDPISKYIDDLPPAWAPITVRHILTHTSGLADFDTGQVGFSYRRDYTFREFVELLGRQPLQFAAGTEWRYTNAFPLLGQVIERASGRTFETFVQTRIFTPLELRSARVKRDWDVVPNRADGYLLKDGAYTHGEALRPRVIAPNGGVMMSVADFAAWDVAITGGRLLTPASLAAMTTPVTLADGRTMSHGLGWFMDTFNGHEFGAHWGTTVAGYSAVIRRYAKDEVTIIALANVDEGGGFAVDAISKGVANLYVPGVTIQGLPPRADADADDTKRLLEVVRLVAAGADRAEAPGLAARLPAAVRGRLADALPASVAVEAPGDERLGPRHFAANPAIVRVRRDRLRGPAGNRYLTLQLSSSGTLLGAIVEEP